MVITAEKFFDIFILCLSWQWDDSHLNHCWTTVDKASRILHGMEIITDKQKKSLFRDRHLQSIFVTRSERRVSAYTETEQKDYVLDSRTRLVINYPMATDFSRERMLRNYRIYLTRNGKKYADAIAVQYADIITEHKYFAEIERQGYLDGAAMGAIIKNYKRRVEKECE